MVIVHEVMIDVGAGAQRYSFEGRDFDAARKPWGDV